VQEIEVAEEVSYKLVVCWAAGTGSEHRVTKTYGDFCRLDGALAKELPLCRLPPRPRPGPGLDETSELSNTSFRDRLNMYLTFLTCHQDVTESYSFENFFGLCTENGKQEQNIVNTTERGTPSINGSHCGSSTSAPEEVIEASQLLLMARNGAARARATTRSDPDAQPVAKPSRSLPAHRFGLTARPVDRPRREPSLEEVGNSQNFNRDGSATVPRPPVRFHTEAHRFGLVAKPVGQLRGGYSLEVEPGTASRARTPSTVSARARVEALLQRSQAAHAAVRSTFPVASAKEQVHRLVQAPNPAVPPAKVQQAEQVQALSTNSSTSNLALSTNRSKSNLEGGQQPVQSRIRSLVTQKTRFWGEDDCELPVSHSKSWEGPPSTQRPVETSSSISPGQQQNLQQRLQSFGQQGAVQEASSPTQCSVETSPLVSPGQQQNLQLRRQSFGRQGTNLEAAVQEASSPAQCSVETSPSVLPGQQPNLQQRRKSFARQGTDLEAAVQALAARDSLQSQQPIAEASPQPSLSQCQPQEQQQQQPQQLQQQRQRPNLGRTGTILEAIDCGPIPETTLQTTAPPTAGDAMAADCAMVKAADAGLIPHATSQSTTPPPAARPRLLRLPSGIKPLNAARLTAPTTLRSAPDPAAASADTAASTAAHRDRSASGASTESAASVGSSRGTARLPVTTTGPAAASADTAASTAAHRDRTASGASTESSAAGKGERLIFRGPIVRELSRPRLPSKVTFNIPGPIVLDEPENEQEVPMSKPNLRDRIPSLNSESGRSSSSYKTDDGSESMGAESMGTASIAGFVNFNRRRPCIVCLKEVQEMAVDPCGHMSMCQKCAPKATVCPVCKGPVEKALRVFVAGND